MEQESDDDYSVDLDNEEEKVVIDPTNVRERIDSTLALLANLKNDRARTFSRADLMEKLGRDLTEYFGYLPELCEMLLTLFSPAECVEYMEASDRPRPLVIRTNTLKTNRKALMAALSKRGVSLEGLDWSKVAIKITESSIPIGATPEYLAGHYMLQSAASMNPVMALAPQPGERVLDMSSAPGGKTSYVAQLMKNSGTVIANDLKPERQKATVANLHRMGVKNAIVCTYDGRKFLKVMKNFDRVLLDAPCSGLGVISRDQSVKLQRTMKDVQRAAHLQKELLCVAVDCCDVNSATGGIIVYSTCSIAVEENEAVIQYILEKRHVKIIESGLEVGKPGFTRYQDKRFHPSLSMSRRFYPHVHNMDGFYVCKLKKLKNGVKSYDNKEDEEDNQEDEEEGSHADDSDNDDHLYEESIAELDQLTKPTSSAKQEDSDEEMEVIEEVPEPTKSSKKDKRKKAEIVEEIVEEEAEEEEEEEVEAPASKKGKKDKGEKAEKTEKRARLNIQQLRAKANKKE